MTTDQIKLIFGLKVKQLRLDSGLTLSELAKKTDVSVSYLNEIEKGKKYPKNDKIVQLAEVFGVDYDQMVSLKLSRKLEPLAKLLNTKFFSDIPLNFFGVDAAELLGIMAHAPADLSAFINTVIEIGRNYNFSTEDFYLAALRTYQEMHSNYFPEIEEIVDNFLLAKNISQSRQLTEQDFKEILEKDFGIKIQFFDEKSHKEIGTLRSVFIPKKKILMINKSISSDQRAFTMAKEIGFEVMNFKKRPLTSSWIQVEDFDHVLNNFKASYFASGLVINKDVLIQELIQIFDSDHFDPNQLINLTEKFNATIETLFHRIANVLIYHFGVNDLFFIRFENTHGSDKFQLTKEMHLSTQYAPTGVTAEHYCRRWKSLDLLKNLYEIQQKGQYKKPIADAQISMFYERENQYLVWAMARPLNILKEKNISVSLGIGLTDELRQKIQFLKGSKLDVKIVNRTCERCGIFDCKERAEAPRILQNQRKTQSMIEAVKNLYS